MVTKMRKKFMKGPWLMVVVTMIVVSLMGGVIAAEAAPLAQAGSNPVMVTVNDTTGTPQSGLNVYAYTGTTYTGLNGVTDGAGQVIFNLADGSYNFRADRNGTQFYSGATSGNDTCTIPGCTDDLVIVTSPVVVTVSDTSSVAQEGLTVYAFSGTTYSGKNGVTDLNGEVSFTLLPGDYNFRADRNGTQFFSGGSSGVNTCSIPSSGLLCTVDDVTVTTPVVVTVSNTSGVVQEGLIVYAFRGTTYSGKTGVTDAAGEVSFTLLPGSYNFRADFNGTQFFSGGAAGVDTCNIPSVGIDCTSDSVTVTGEIVVTVEDTVGTTQAGLNVYAFNGTTYSGKTGVTDGNGQVTFTLTPGDYNFRADLNGTQFFSGGSSGTNTCTVPGCTADTVSVTAPVLVTVLDTNNDTQEGLSVYAFSGTTYAGKTGVTNAAGEVSFTLLPGEYNFRADLNGYQFFSGGAAGTNTCTIPDTGVQTCTTDGVTVPLFGLVDVTVTDGGVTVPNQVVYLFDSTGTTYLSRNSTTDANGVATFNLPAGDYLFATDLGGTRYWSPAVCPVPGCTKSAINANFVPPTVLPASTCDLAGSTRTCEFWAKEGTLTLVDGTVVPIWGFADSATGPAQLPGPMIIANEGETVEVIFHNAMSAETVALLFGGQAAPPDLEGIVPGGTTTYSFTAVAPGTFRYEAGLTPNGARQVAMGLYGALIVRPQANPTGQAYDVPTLDSSYDDEALLILSEIDPDFQADPNNFDMVQYSPKFWLINGRSFLDTDTIPTTPGNRVLLRYINAGLQEHTLGILGLHQSVLSTDGQPYQYAKTSVVRTLAAGESADALATIPVTAVINTRYPVYNAGQQQLHNNGTGPYGGILTFLDVTSGDRKPVAGPLTKNLQVTPDPTAGNIPVTLSGDLDSTGTSRVNITEWEYFINELGPEGTGTLLSVASPATQVSVSTSLSPAVLATIPAGDVTFYVRGKDANGTWGPVNSVIFDLIVEGPAITSLSLNQSPANGDLPVGIQATADETTVGDIDVVAAEYFIGTPGADGTGTSMTLNVQAPISSLTAVIDAATIQGLAEGIHAIQVHAQDALGNWGGFGTIDLVVDKSGPASVGLNLAPNPNNGTLSVNSSSPGVRLEILATDINNVSTIKKAEGFIDFIDETENPNGSGFPLIASDALYDSSSETAYFIIPLTTIRQLPEGPHAIDFHALDAAGNWGPISSLTLLIDKTGPSVNNVTGTPNPITRRRRQPLNLTADTIDAEANIVAAEWFDSNDPGAGQGMAMLPMDGLFDAPTEVLTTTINVSRWSFGDHIVSVRAKDASGNWGAVMTTTVTIQRGGGGNVAAFGDDFETNNFSGWDNAEGTVDINRTAASSGNWGLVADIGGGLPAYLTARVPDGTQDKYGFSFDFNPNQATTAGEEHEIFLARNSSGTAIFGIWFEQNSQGPEIMAWVRQTSGVMALTDGVQIDNKTQRIDLVWEANESAELLLKVNGAVQASLSGLDTVAYQLDEVRLGSISGGATTASGQLYFDAFDVAVPGEFRLFLPITIGGSG